MKLNLRAVILEAAVLAYKDIAGGHLFILDWFIAEQHVQQREISRSSFSRVLNLNRSCAHRVFKRCCGLKQFGGKKTTYFFVLKTVSRPAYNTGNKEEKNCMPKMGGAI